MTCVFISAIHYPRHHYKLTPSSTHTHTPNEEANLDTLVNLTGKLCKHKSFVFSLVIALVSSDLRKIPHLCQSKCCTVFH